MKDVIDWTNERLEDALFPHTSKEKALDKLLQDHDAGYHNTNEIEECIACILVRRRIYSEITPLMRY